MQDMGNEAGKKGRRKWNEISNFLDKEQLE